MTPDVTHHAAEAFRRIEASALARTPSGQTPTGEAARHVRAWAAIALHCGVDPAVIHPEAPEIMEQRSTWPECRRWLLAEDYCPSRIWAPILTEARERAISRYEAGRTPANLASARKLIAIAEALRSGCGGRHIPPPGLQPAQPERKAA